MQNRRQRQPLLSKAQRSAAAAAAPSSSSSSHYYNNIFLFIFLIFFVVCLSVILGLLIWISVISDPCPCTKIAKYTGSTYVNQTSMALQLPAADLVLAFFGDQGLGHHSKQVLRLLKSENASVIFHLGDFDYEASPSCWIKQIFSVLDPLSPDLDYFAVMGNHDAKKKHLLASYSKKIVSLLHPIAAETSCEGVVGVKATCIWKGLAFLQIGIGSTSCYSQDIVSWVSTELNRLKPIYPWSFCLFHKNIRNMQMGGGGIEDVPLALYEACRLGGAIIATGHDHRYARTHLMESFGPTPIISSTLINVDINKTFSFVSGLGGYSMYTAVPNLLANPWWAASLSIGDALEDYGAFFIRIGSSDRRTATGYFKTATSGTTIDIFNITI